MGRQMGGGGGGGGGGGRGARFLWTQRKLTSTTASPIEPRPFAPPEPERPRSELYSSSPSPSPTPPSSMVSAATGGVAAAPGSTRTPWQKSSAGVQPMYATSFCVWRTRTPTCHSGRYPGGCMAQRRKGTE